MGCNMVLEILGSIIATSTAKSVIKFVDEKVADYVSKKYGNKPPADIEALVKDVKELKEKLDEKQKDEVTQIDVEEMRKSIIKIGQRQSSLPDTIISDSNFLEWNDMKLRVEMDIEGQAPIVRRELEILLSKTHELKKSEKNSWRIQNILVAIDMNLNDMKKWIEMFQMQPLSIYDDKAKLAEIALRNTLYEARNTLKPYYEVE